VGWDGNIILPDNFVVNIIFSIWLPPEMWLKKQETFKLLNRSTCNCLQQK
jgi:hypothetical protein